VLKVGQSLWKSDDDILPGLAQSVRDCGIDLAEMASNCGVHPTELRRMLALSRVGEQLRPGELWRLSDQELISRLQHAAREYDIQPDELLKDTSPIFAASLGVDANLPLRSRVAKIMRRLHCWVCCQLRLQRYRVHLVEYRVGGTGEQLVPAYACDRCLPAHLIGQRVRQITRLAEAEIPNSKIRSAAFAAIAVLLLSGLYVRGIGVTRKSSKMLLLRPPTSASAKSAAEITPVSRSTMSVTVELAKKDLPNATAPSTHVDPLPAAVMSAPMAQSPPSELVVRKKSKVFTAVPLASLGPETNQRLGAQNRREVIDRTTAPIAASTEVVRTMPSPSAHRNPSKQKVAAEVPPPAETRVPRKVSPGTTARGEAPALAAGKRTASIGNGTSSEHAAATSPRYRQPRYTIQIDAAMNRNDADSMAQRFQRLGYTPHLVLTVIAGQTWYKVEVGPYATQDEAAAAQEQLHQKYNSAYVSR
jgi:septal ring-binding cell division protein DamX